MRGFNRREVKVLHYALGCHRAHIGGPMLDDAIQQLWPIAFPPLQDITDFG